MYLLKTKMWKNSQNAFKVFLKSNFICNIFDGNKSQFSPTLGFSWSTGWNIQWWPSPHRMDLVSPFSVCVIAPLSLFSWKMEKGASKISKEIELCQQIITDGIKQARKSLLKIIAVMKKDWTQFPERKPRRVLKHWVS